MITMIGFVGLFNGIKTTGRPLYVQKKERKKQENKNQKNFNLMFFFCFILLYFFNTLFKNDSKQRQQALWFNNF